MSKFDGLKSHKIVSFKNKDLRRRHQVLQAKRDAKLAQQDLEAPPQRVIGNLEERQRMAVELLTDFHSNLKTHQICSILGITTKTLNTWRQEPYFMKLIDAELTRKRSIMRLEAYKGWFKAVRQGDTKVIKDYFKMTGDLTEELNVNVNDLSDMSTEDLEREIRAMEEDLGERPTAKKRKKQRK